MTVFIEYLIISIEVEENDDKKNKTKCGSDAEAACGDISHPVTDTEAMGIESVEFLSQETTGLYSVHAQQAC